MAVLAKRNAGLEAVARPDVMGDERHVVSLAAGASIFVSRQHGLTELALRTTVTIGRPVRVQWPAVLRARVGGVHQLGTSWARAGVPVLAAWVHGFSGQWCPRLHVKTSPPLSSHTSLPHVGQKFI